MQNLITKNISWNLYLPSPSLNPTLVDRKSSQLLVICAGEIRVQIQLEGIQGRVPFTPSPGEVLASEAEPGLAA